MTKKLLLVDDNDDFRFSVTEGFKTIAPDIEVIGVDGGKKAFSILADNKVDVILLDIMMPGMDGWEVVSRLKSDSALKRIPILILTAKTDSFSKGMGKLTAEDYIEKPCDIIELKKRIEKIIKK